MIVVIINVKNFLERHFFKNKRTFIKKAVLHTTTLMHCKARQVLGNLLMTKNEIAQN